MPPQKRKDMNNQDVDDYWADQHRREAFSKGWEKGYYKGKAEAAMDIHAQRFSSSSSRNHPNNGDDGKQSEPSSQSQPESK